MGMREDFPFQPLVQISVGPAVSGARRAQSPPAPGELDVPKPGPSGQHGLQPAQPGFRWFRFFLSLFCFLMGLIHSQEKLFGWLMWGGRLRREPDSASGTRGRGVWACGAVRISHVTSSHPCIPHILTSTSTLPCRSSDLPFPSLMQHFCCRRAFPAAQQQALPQ